MSGLSGVALILTLAALWFAFGYGLGRRRGYVEGYDQHVRGGWFGESPERHPYAPSQRDP